MKKKNVKIGGRYLAKVSGKLTVVRVTGFRDGPLRDSIVAVNERTGRTLYLRTAGRLRPNGSLETKFGVERSSRP